MKIARYVVACRQTEIPSAAVNADSIAGFYLLNEGNKGSNRCTLDYYDYQSEVYIKNVFAERNPGMDESLGDLGNDLQRYGSKLYAVVNCSNLVEVIDVATAKHIGQVSVPNCRYGLLSAHASRTASASGCSRQFVMLRITRIQRAPSPMLLTSSVSSFSLERVSELTLCSLVRRFPGRVAMFPQTFFPSEAASF